METFWRDREDTESKHYSYHQLLLLLYHILIPITTKYHVEFLTFDNFGIFTTKLVLWNFVSNIADGTH